MSIIQIKQRLIGGDAPTYFIADISANHDGDLGRAKALIALAKEAGADAAKFQNFRAEHIVSSVGFESLGAQRSHQVKWRKSVVQVYAEASLPWEWTGELKAACDAVGIDYFSTPYDFEAVDMLEPFVSMYKIGSGDITWPEMLEYVARKGKPVLVACGASTMADVERAAAVMRSNRIQWGLMQCNTNYTGCLENFRHLHLRVLTTFAATFPDAVLGLSDHTPGHASVLGAVALGARVIEKHFTDDVSRDGPDHAFSMTPSTWREMVDRTRELELGLGLADKFIADNERDTVIVQRRSLRAARPLAVGTVLKAKDVVALRPAPPEALAPYELSNIVGRHVRVSIAEGEHLRWEHFQ